MLSVGTYKLSGIPLTHSSIKSPHLRSALCFLVEFFIAANNRCPFLGISMVEAFALLCSEVVDNRVVIVIDPLSPQCCRRRRF